MRVLIAAALAVSLSATSLFAADAGSSLAPGQAAGVQKAQMTDTTWIWVLGSAAVLAVIVAATQSNKTSAVAPNGTALPNTATS
jgi:hypothetical protein